MAKKKQTLGDAQVDVLAPTTAFTACDGEPEQAPAAPQTRRQRHVAASKEQK